jgi:hypothetical protein
MSKISYISGSVLSEIDQLKYKLDSYRGERSIKLHNQRKTFLEHEAINTSLFIEYPELKGIPQGRMDRDARKLLKRLQTAWKYCVQNIDCNGDPNQRDLEIVQAIIRPEGKLGIRKGDDECGIDLHDAIQPPPTLLVQQYINEMFDNLVLLRSEAHPIETASFLHLHTLYIHPFEDGNGRTARMLQNYMLHCNGYVPTVIEAQERDLYFKLLDSAKDGIIVENIRTQQPFYEFIASKVHEGLEKVLSR